MSKRNHVQSEALSHALKLNRCGLGISMGVGKTLIGLQYIDQLQQKNMHKLRVLVVAPKVSIFNTWLDDAEKFSIDPGTVDSITFSTYLSLNKQLPENYDILILDECHSLLYTHLEFLEKFTGRILGLTGTPPRYHTSEKGQMVSRFCPIMYRYIVTDAVEDEILNDYRIIVHYVSLSQKKDLMIQTKDKKWWTSEKENYEYWSKRIANATSGKEKQIMSIMRMKAMMGFKSKTDYAKQLMDKIEDKCIVFANTIDQARELCDYTYDSKNPDSEGNLQLFKHGNIEKLSCVMQLNEGVNIPNLKAGIILHAYGNERKSNQRIGRLLRLNPKDCATAHILCYRDSVDEKWISEALSDFDTSKIKFVNPTAQVLNFDNESY